MQFNFRGNVARLGLAAMAAMFLASGAVSAAEEVNIYSYRQEFLIKPFLDKFTEKTGIKVNVVYAEKGMVERLVREGENTPADMVLTVDIARLKEHADAGVLQPVKSKVLEENIPAQYRAPEGLWYGLSTRVRILGVSKDRVPQGAITSYEDLGDPKWKGKICTRPGSNEYNRALVASLIAAHGEQKAEELVKKIVANFARKPQGNDRAQVKAVMEGVCDIAIMNHYYYFAMKMNDKEPEQKQWADAIRIVFPNQDGRGTHVNISGGGITKHAKNKANAVKLLEFLSSDQAQQMYAAVNYEFPVNPHVQPSDEVRALGKFTSDPLPIARIADLSEAAQKVVDRTGW